MSSLEALPVDQVVAALLTITGQQFREGVVPALNAALWALPPALEEILRMIFYDGCSDRELADLLDRSLPEVQTRRQKALQALQKRLALEQGWALTIDQITHLLDLAGRCHAAPMRTPVPAVPPVPQAAEILRNRLVFLIQLDRILRGGPAVRTRRGAVRIRGTHPTTPVPPDALLFNETKISEDRRTTLTLCIDANQRLWITARTVDPRFLNTPLSITLHGARSNLERPLSFIQKQKKSRILEANLVLGTLTQAAGQHIGLRLPDEYKEKTLFLLPTSPLQIDIGW